MNPDLNAGRALQGIRLVYIYFSLGLFSWLQKYKPRMDIYRGGLKINFSLNWSPWTDQHLFKTTGSRV